LAAQITVEGVSDETVYTDQVSFRVPVQAGFSYTAALNGEAVPTAVMVPVDRPEYYELVVRRRNLSTSAEESMTVQFIVRSSARGNSEWGLPPWVPLVRIPSAAAEFAGSSLDVIVPHTYPRGLAIPVIAWVRDAGGERVGVNGTVTAAEFPAHALELFRGVGSASLPAASVAGDLSYTAAIHSLSSAKTIRIEAATVWTPASGTIAANTNWGEDARIDITGDLTVAGTAVLTVGAGSIVRVAPGAEIEVLGRLVVNGTKARPAVFTPANRSAPWGGINFRNDAEPSQGELTGAILTGSGADDDWFDNNPGNGSSHRDEQPLLYTSDGAVVNLTDCYLVDNAGQAGHGEGSFLTMDRCLIQKCITAGQYNGGTVDLTDCALIEFPAEGAPFEDNDNDGLYLTGGSHFLSGCLVGWALDDGVDAGSGSAGSVSVAGSWFESCYHEAMAWSESRLSTVRDTVATNSGQGIECGFDTPMVDAARCLSTANVTGARFGDNYDWDYDGFLTLVDSLVLYNHRDVWGLNWDDWTYRAAQMDVRGNYLTQENTYHPENTLWNPALHSGELVPYLPTPATRVGIGIAVRPGQFDPAAAGGIPVRLSTFATHEVTVDYSVSVDGVPGPGGTLVFEPGRTVRTIDLEALGVGGAQVFQVALSSPSGGDITGLSRLSFAEPVTLVDMSSEWRYLDTNTYPGDGWQAIGFPDGSWAEGGAELGCCEGDETTEIDIGPDTARYPTVYFRQTFEVANPALFTSLTIRLLRDDGAIVHLNGDEAFRSNMPEGPVSHSTPSSTTVSGGAEGVIQVMEVDASFLTAGTNVVAVEVHQSDPESSDLSFALELIGTPSLEPLPPAFVRGDGNGDRRLDISDPMAILFVLYREAPTDCQDALDSDDTGILDLNDALEVLNFLFLNGPAMPAPFPLPGEDPTDADPLGCARV
jgi:hypothetical protein